MTCNTPGCRRAVRPPTPSGVQFGTCTDDLRLTPAPAPGSHSPLAVPRSSGPRIPVSAMPPPLAVTQVSPAH